MGTKIKLLNSLLCTTLTLMRRHGVVVSTLVSINEDALHRDRLLPG